jgi:hypothetical protein
MSRVVLRGPTRPIIVREKQKVAGIWVNADSIDFRSAPAYYAIASSRPIDKIVDARTAAIYELGLKRFAAFTNRGNPDPRGAAVHRRAG